jgi:hypothetical protein
MMGRHARFAPDDHFCQQALSLLKGNSNVAI